MCHTTAHFALAVLLLTATVRRSTAGLCVTARASASIDVGTSAFGGWGAQQWGLSAQQTASRPSQQGQSIWGKLGQAVGMACVCTALRNAVKTWWKSAVLCDDVGTDGGGGLL
eukprot:1158736-Pelagomonas_calceolata.AAC.1